MFVILCRDTISRVCFKQAESSLKYCAVQIRKRDGGKLLFMDVITTRVVHDGCDCKRLNGFPLSSVVCIRIVCWSRSDHGQYSMQHQQA